MAYLKKFIENHKIFMETLVFLFLFRDTSYVSRRKQYKPLPHLVKRIRVKERSKGMGTYTPKFIALSTANTERIANVRTASPSWEKNDVPKVEDWIETKDFQIFAAKEFSSEHINFLVDLKKLENSIEGHHSPEYIYENYVRLGSPQEININQATRKDFEDQHWGNPLTANSFSQSKKEIILLLQNDTFNRFNKERESKHHPVSPFLIFSKFRKEKNNPLNCVARMISNIRL